MAAIRVMQVGLGPIGRKVVDYMLQRDGVEVVGAVDPAADKAGKTLAELCERADAPSVTVQSDITSALAETPCDVAVLTTVSDFVRGAEQAGEIARHGVHVVSTCEEMSYPWQTAPQLAQQLDEVAKEHKVAVLGTGINPGFLMDCLPSALTALCQDVTAVKVSRLQDATFRRVPFQQKIGAGLTLDEFEAKKAEGTLRHVGLTESMHMIAAAFGWRLDKTEDIISPIVAETEITSGYKKIEPGMAAGVRQVGRGYCQGKEVISLLFCASVGEKDPRDTVEIKGTPDITSTIPGCVNGDIGTCAITVNAVRSIMSAQPGLRTMINMPVVSWFG